MIEVYRIMNDVEKVHRDLLLIIFHNVRTRGHTVKLLGSRFKTNWRKFFFTQGGINL